MASVWVKRELDSVVPRSVIATFAGMRYAIAVHCPQIYAGRMAESQALLS